MDIRAVKYMGQISRIATLKFWRNPKFFTIWVRVLINFLQHILRKNVYE